MYNKFEARRIPDNKILFPVYNRQGDSGGPLMAPQTLRGKTYYYQIGIGMYALLI